MNTNEEMIFDELMRQKLGNYSELPDMTMMDKIHAKKNRIIRLYKLSKLFTVLCIIGLSFWGIYMLIKPAEMVISQNNQAVKQPISVVAKDNNSISRNYKKSTANASTKGRENRNNFETQKTQQPTVKTQISSAQLNNKINIESNSTIKNSLPKNSLSNINQFTNSNKKDSVIVKQNEQKIESKEVSKNCKAAFDYYVSYDGKYNFTNFSKAEISTKTLWDFGDGTTSDLSSPNHIYKNAGNYIVALNISDINNSCSDMMQKNITYNLPSTQQNQGISVKGNIISGSDKIENGNVVLLVFDSDKNSYSEIARTKISLTGEYNFSNLKVGTYFILADANNPKYIPTYWGNTTDMSQAAEIDIMNNDVDDLVGLNILLADNKNFSGNFNDKFFISDTSSQNYVIVMDQNSNVVGKAKVDNNGNVNLSGFPPGNYLVMNPQNENMNPVKVSPGNGSEIGGGSITLPTANITLIPNPATNNVKFNINIAYDNELAEVMIMSVSGIMVYDKSYICTTGSFLFDIDISALPPGNYYVLVNVGGSQTLTGRMIKSGNNSSFDH